MKKILTVLSLLAISFSSFAKDISQSELQNYIKAAPAVINWSQNQEELKNIDFGSMLSGSQNGTAAIAISSVAAMKDSQLYKNFETLTARYGFTPEQFISVGSEITKAYLHSSKTNVSSQNKKKVNQLMGGLQGVSGANTHSANTLMGTLGNTTNAAQAKTPKVNAHNLALVNKYMPQLQKLYAAMQ